MEEEPSSRTSRLLTHPPASSCIFLTSSESLLCPSRSRTVDSCWACPPPFAGIDQLIPPPRPLGLRSTDSVVKGVNVDDLDLGGGEVRVEAFSVVEKVKEGRRLLLTPLSVDLSVDLSFPVGGLLVPSPPTCSPPSHSSMKVTPSPRVKITCPSKLLSVKKPSL